MRIRRKHKRKREREAEVPSAKSASEDTEVEELQVCARDPLAGRRGTRGPTVPVSASLSAGDASYIPRGFPPPLSCPLPLPPAVVTSLLRGKPRGRREGACARPVCVRAVRKRESEGIDWGRGRKEKIYIYTQNQKERGRNE